MLYNMSKNKGISMKKVVKVTETEIVLDDGSTVELLFELDKLLTIEEAQKIYEQSLKVRDSLLASGNEITESK
jgi:hypothetical protein